MAKLSLQWPVDQKGYSIEPAHPVSTKGAKTHAGLHSSGPSIVRNDGKLQFRDVMQIPALYKRLGNCPLTESGALDFVSKYGFLVGGRSESVADIHHQIKVVSSLLSAWETHDWAALKLWMIDNRKNLRLNPEFREGDQPQLFFAPAALIDAIYLQLFRDISTGANFRLCKRPACGEWFYYGPGTEHRSTAQYCSTKCEKAHAYEKSKRRKPKTAKRGKS